MSACPFCFSEMQGALSQGLQREVCEACGALWLQGATLEKVVGHSATDTLLREARGKPGACKGCQESLQYVPNCPRCGRTSPTCPQCHNRPLPVAEVSGVKVDICTACRGIGLDAGELEQLQASMKQERFLELELRPPPARAQNAAATAPMACATCARKLKPQHAFTWDARFYCGSCAPSEAAPYEVELTKAAPGHSLGYSAGDDLAALGLAQGPISVGLTWLFSKLFR
jgi:Zn-finger nucleic acid-binding protein